MVPGECPVEEAQAIEQGRAASSLPEARRIFLTPFPGLQRGQLTEEPALFGPTRDGFTPTAW